MTNCKTLIIVLATIAAVLTIQAATLFGAWQVYKKINPYQDVQQPLEELK
jgi:hypothetical protein